MCMILTTLHDMHNGLVSTRKLRDMREEGGYSFRTELCIDGMSVFSALLMDPVKPPSEQSLAGHLWWLSDQLKTKQLDELTWIDTRDMSADPLTKGSAPRELILSLMKGELKYKHDTYTRTQALAKAAPPSAKYSSVLPR